VNSARPTAIVFCAGKNRPNHQLTTRPQRVKRCAVIPAKKTQPPRGQMETETIETRMATGLTILALCVRDFLSDKNTYVSTYWHPSPWTWGDKLDAGTTESGDYVFVRIHTGRVTISAIRLIVGNPDDYLF
jgi:hypothetical protein